MDPLNEMAHLDDEIVGRVALNRREALAKAAKAGLGAAVLTSVPVAFGLSARQAFGQTLPQAVVDVLNFALTLEYLEAEFYTRGRAQGNLIPAANANVFAILERHENVHVSLLRTVLGARAIAKPNFDLTAKGAFPDVLSNFVTYATVAQALEDTGVRAYKGQAPILHQADTSAGKPILTTALQIHSIEARHAARIRRLNQQAGVPQKPWITADVSPDPRAAAVYAGDANTVQGPAGNMATNIPAGATLEHVTEAFDEPLTREQVLAIATPFLA